MVYGDSGHSGQGGPQKAGISFLESCLHYFHPEWQTMEAVSTNLVVIGANSWMITGTFRFTQ